MKRDYKITVLTIGVIASALICYFDYRTGPNLSFLIFYFVPVLFVLWYAGSLAGLSVALSSTVAWIAIDRLVRHPHARLLLADWNWFRAAMFIFVAYLLSLWKNLLDQEHELAFEDALTGLANRRHFTECAQREIQRATRYRQPLTVAFVDIDNFKRFNDKWGHVEAGRAVIEKIRDKLMDSMRNRHWPVSFSIGAVSYLDSPPSIDEMLRKADDRMYNVKKAGKDGCQFDVYVA